MTGCSGATRVKGSAASATPSQEHEQPHTGTELPESAGLGNEDGRPEPTQPRVFETHRAAGVLKHGRATGDQLGVTQLDG